MNNLSEMSDGYLELINDIKEKLKKQRVSIVLNANSGMICLYWKIGEATLEVDHFVGANKMV